MGPTRILAVDDERMILENIRDFLTQYQIVIESNPAQARDRFSNEFFDIIIADYKMPQISGLDLLMEAKKRKAYRYGILVTAYADIPLLKEFLNHGLIKKFLEKPIRLPSLQKVVDEAVVWCKAEEKRERELQELRELCDLGPLPIIGSNTTLASIMKDLDRISSTDENVLITGETGTGKEVIAREIHRRSNRRENVFIKINCGAIPDSIMESELFGFTKGAFSGADRDKPGRIELAHEGTLFLDELAELKPELQTKLLQVIQDKQIERLGSTTPKNIDFRLICATNRDVDTLMERAEFRKDLYFRISTFHIELPPLRDRREDIPLFVSFLLNQYTRELGRKPVELSDEALKLLEYYDWPGNVRELESVLKRAVVLLNPEENTIGPEAFASFSINPERSSGAGGSYEEAIALLAEEIHNPQRDLKTIEKDLLKSILRAHDYSVKQAREKTGIQKDKLYRVLRELREEPR